METLRQTSSVAEYQQKFEQLAHGILRYNDGYDDVYFVTHFLTRLKEEIRSVIALHRPKIVNTTSALALLQEEELELSKQKSVLKKLDSLRTKPVY